MKEAIEKILNREVQWNADRLSEKDRIRSNRTFLFGGSVSNLYSEYLLKETPIDFNLGSRNYELTDSEGEMFEPDYDFWGRTYRTDYGLVVFKKFASFAPNGVAGFMGCHGYDAGIRDSVNRSCGQAVCQKNFARCQKIR